MTDETENQLPENGKAMSIADLLAMLQGPLDPEVQARREAGQPEIEILAALAFKKAPNDKCRDFFDHNGCQLLNTLKGQGADLYRNGPTIPLAEAAKAREFVDHVLDMPGFPETTKLHTPTFRQIAEDLGDYVDSAVRRQAVVGDENALNRAASQDVYDGLVTLLRGLRNLTNPDEMCDLRDPSPDDE